MARPTNKASLIELSIKNYDQLIVLINSFSAQQKEATFSFEDRDRNIRDVVGHLNEWHLMMQDWYRQGMSGVKPMMPREGYTWKTLPALNQVIWQQCQGVILEDALARLEASHSKIHGLIESHTDEELFTKKYYGWTGTTSLGAYFISCTSSHYDWAIKKIKRYKRETANVGL